MILKASLSTSHFLPPSYLKRTSAPQRGPVPNQESEQTERTDTPLKMEQETGQAEAASTKVTADQDTATQTASSAAPDNTASSQEVEQAETPNSAEASSGTGSATPDSDASGPVEFACCLEPKSEPEPETGDPGQNPIRSQIPTPAPSEEKVPLAAKLLQRFRNLPIFAKISIFSVGAFLIVLLLIVYFAWYLPQRSNVIQEIMVLNPYLELSPGDYGRLLIAAIGEDPDLDPDLSSLQCHSNDNPLITTAKVNDWAEGNDWTMTWYVLAAQDWTADLPYNGSVSVEGGKAEKVTVPVYVVDEDDKGTRVDPADIPEFWDAADGVISRGEEGLMMRRIRSLAICVVALFCVVASSLTALAWSDNTEDGRPTYSLQEINEGALGDNITFNSIVFSESDYEYHKDHFGQEVPATTLTMSATSLMLCL